jgi:NHL repeat
LYPASLALDASQNLYIADSGQHRVRVVIGP